MLYMNNDNMPKVSFIVPIYNVEKYLHSCISSIMNQSLKDIEIICINDKTSDKSMKKIECYLKDERIRVINNKQNLGLSESRNIGLKAARGKYVWFVDSDDRLSCDNAVETLYNIAEKNDTDIIQFNPEWKFETEELKRKYIIKNRSGEKKYIEVLYGREMLRRQLLYNDWYSMVQFLFFKREFLLSQNLCFPNVIHEDIYFSIAAMIYADRVYYCDKKLYIYFRRKKSITTSNNNYIYRGLCLMSVVMMLIEELKTFDCQDETVKLLEKYLFERCDEAILLYLRGLKNQEPIKYTDCSQKVLMSILLNNRYPYIANNINSEVCKKICSAENLVVYGAGRVSKSVRRFLFDLGVKKYIVAVTHSQDRTRELKSIEEKKNTLVLISVMKDKQQEMIEYARKLGFKDFVIIV